MAIPTVSGCRPRGSALTRIGDFGDLVAVETVPSTASTRIDKLLSHVSNAATAAAMEPHVNDVNWLWTLAKRTGRKYILTSSKLMNAYPTLDQDGQLAARAG